MLVLLSGVLLGYVASSALPPWVDRDTPTRSTVGGPRHTHAAVLALSALAGLGAIAEGLWGSGS